MTVIIIADAIAVADAFVAVTEALFAAATAAVAVTYVLNIQSIS